MERSGLKRLLIEAVCAKNTVPHTMSGKAVSRALRAHLLVESALTCVLLDKCTSWKDSQDTHRLVFSNLQQGELSIDEVNDDAHVTKLQNELETGKYKLSEKSRTACQTLDSVFRLHCHSKDVHESRKNRELDYAVRMYPQNVDFFLQVRVT